MDARDFFRIVLGLIFVCIGIWGNAFGLLPWPLMGKVDESRARPIPWRLGATIFVVAGIGLIYLGLRPILSGR